MSFPNAIYCNGAEAPIFEADDVQKYPLGQRMILEDGRVFVYAKAGNSLRTKHGAKNSLPQHVAAARAVAAADKGVTSVVLTTTTADGVAGNGVITADELVGGYAILFPQDGVSDFIRRIVSNTATGVSGGVRAMTIELDAPTPIALPSNAGGEITASPYASVVYSTNAGLAVVGVPTVSATVGQFLWLQTWGACWLAPQASVGVGKNLGLVFRHDGSLEAVENTAAALTVPDATYSTTQYAGFALFELANNTQAAPLIMLQISP